MKNKFLLATFFISCLVLISNAQVYVKSDAAGAGDGSSWADAYTHPQMAFDASSPNDEIWIAAGTYLPVISGDTINAFFTFAHDLKVYGGFDGTETELSQRDWENNLTVLSGDHLQNDLDGDYGTNKSDNSFHVMWLTDTITNNTVLDGLVFRNGATAPESGSGNDRRGGGLLTYGAPIIQNCTFMQNRGYFGGGLYPRGGDAAGVQILNCDFIDNNSQFGGGVYINSTTAVIDGCLFEGNTTASLGGGLYNNTAQGSVITNCDFIENATFDTRGGGIYNTASPSIIRDCYFDRNRAVTSTGAGIMVRVPDDTDPFTTTIIENCTFERNQARWGGAVGCYDQQSQMIVRDCSFNANSSTTSGGASTNGFGGMSIFDNCMFMENTSNNGGAHYNQNDSARLVFMNCSYFDNSAQERGGVMSFSGDDEPLNTAPLSEVTISRCIMQGNLAIEQAGAVNINNVNVDIDRTLMSLNFVTNVDGIGGAISYNTSDSIDTEYSITNSTITQNTASIGAGIANWQADATATSTLTLQNVILHNPTGNDYDIEFGEPVCVSTGGNLSSDNSMVDILTHVDDDVNILPGFVDDLVDYHLLNSSPCVNTGIDGEPGDLDIEGNPIVGRTDKGAFENQVVVGIREQTLNEFGNLEIFPNPIRNELSFSLENDWKGEIQISILDIQGKVITNYTGIKETNEFSDRVDVTDLVNGIYVLTISNGQSTSAQKLIKR